VELDAQFVDDVDVSLDKLIGNCLEIQPSGEEVVVIT
jgi:hypothetical protein